MKTDPLGKRLLKALTKDQLARLLSAIFHLLSEQKIRDLLRIVDPDIKSTLSQLLTKKKPEKIISDQKFIEEWHKLWAEWNNIVSDVGDEEGSYVFQEYHWEEPYFDCSALSLDLDKVASKMYPCLEKIHQLKAAEMLGEPRHIVRYFIKKHGLKEEH